MKKEKQDGLLKDLYNRYIYDEIAAKGAEMSFYLLLSFFPFLIFLISFVSTLPAIHINRYITTLAQIMPSSAYEIVGRIIQQAVSDKSGKLMPVSFIITLWSASASVTAFIKGINKAYDQKENRSFWKVFAVSVVFTIGLMSIIIFSLVLIVFGARLGAMIFQIIGMKGLFYTIWNSLRHTVAITAIFLTISFLYYYTPNHHGIKPDAIPGAAAATLGWVITSLGFSLYANRFANYTLIYGSLGGIIALLTWIYLSSLVLLMGAEINALLHFRRNGKLKIRNKKY